MKAQIIPLFSLESRIKRSLRDHLKKIGFTRTPNGFLQPPNDSKETIRSLHSAQRNALLKREKDFIKRTWPNLKDYFANGTDIVPDKIVPSLELIEGGTWQSDLFRLASLIWSVPVSQGYGRRLRFLVWDKSNGKLLGLLGLGDPVFNLRVRDDLIGWTALQRKNHLVCLMDAYVLGAVPPYNLLMCGKMIACLVRTREVRDHFAQKYQRTKGIISGKRKHAKLVAVTTSSALGRSSLYNRLKLNGNKYFKSIGYTAGWGHFHVPGSLFKAIREYLELKGHRYSGNNRFGEGPNWRLRAIRQTLHSLNLNPNLLRHGIAREVFLSELASNGKRYLIGKIKQLQYRGLLSVAQVAKHSIERWIIPRSLKNTEYLNWTRENLLHLLSTNNNHSISSATTKQKELEVGSSKL
ncbi:MAG TPA: Druantia anti-phage system protein DruA [Candidatus Hodarchaeales archaeon]|nr:Druantia anti-phage system protein DruA [Candidatus Hodarchaeales archaeon]